MLAAALGVLGTNMLMSVGCIQIKYKTLGWPMVAVLMIAEIVSNGMLSIPSAIAVVGMVPGLILTVFLGVFATYTSWLLVKFKMRHPEVHNMGDAGKILFGWFGRELLALGTIIFAVFATGGQLLAGQIAISALSNNSICPLLGAGTFRTSARSCRNGHRCADGRKGSTPSSPS